MIYETKRDIAPKVTRKYAQTMLTMEEIAKIFDNNHYKFKVNASGVSNMIYYCIFYRIIPADVEERIIQKIVENRKRHCKYPARVGNSLYSKYNKTIKDRSDYEYLIESTVYIKEYLDSKAELSYSENIDLTDYISSEDERDYKTPKSISTLLNNIKFYEGILFSRGIDIGNLELEAARINKKANYIKSLYDKI